jgi:hypothetical protein
VAVIGSGSTPGATLELQVPNPLIPPSGGPPLVLNIPESHFLTTNPCGQIGEPPNQTCDGSVARLGVPDYTSPVEVLIEQCLADCGRMRPVRRLARTVELNLLLPRAVLQ